MRRFGIFTILILGATPVLAQRLAADLTCAPTKHDLVYDCRILLKEAASETPVSGAAVSVTADMPSMPMAHQTAPVKAVPGKAPGEYHARIALEMFGEWALKLTVRGRVRDVIVKKIEFAEPQR
jgi:YtkA-like